MKSSKTRWFLCIGHPSGPPPNVVTYKIKTGDIAEEIRDALTHAACFGQMTSHAIVAPQVYDEIVASVSGSTVDGPACRVTVLKDRHCALADIHCVHSGTIDFFPPTGAMTGPDRGNQ